MTIDQRAEVLIQALPYIKAYNQKIVVIKYGGNAMINEDLKRAVMGDLLLLTLVGVKVVLVHGGGPEITDLLKRLGKESEFINGLRVTDREAADIVQMVLAGKVGKGLVGYIQSMGGKAIGLCGMDGHMIEARKLDDVHGYVGEIVNVNTQPILDVLEKGYIPVISTVGCDSEGNPYNINADTAAAKIAIALGAEKLILLTDVRGLLRDRNDESTLISRIHPSDVPRLMKENVIAGGMIPKIDCCVEAVRRGVHAAHILDGRQKHSILIELLTDAGVGTMIQ